MPKVQEFFAAPFDADTVRNALETELLKETIGWTKLTDTAAILSATSPTTATSSDLGGYCTGPGYDASQKRLAAIHSDLGSIFTWLVDEQLGTLSEEQNNTVTVAAKSLILAHNGYLAALPLWGTATQLWPINSDGTLGTEISSPAVVPATVIDTASGPFGQYVLCGDGKVYRFEVDGSGIITWTEVSDTTTNPTAMGLTLIEDPYASHLTTSETYAYIIDNARVFVAEIQAGGSFGEFVRQDRALAQDDDTDFGQSSQVRYANNASSDRYLNPMSFLSFDDRFMKLPHYTSPTYHGVHDDLYVSSLRDDGHLYQQLVDRDIDENARYGGVVIGGFGFVTNGSLIEKVAKDVEGSYSVFTQPSTVGQDKLMSLIVTNGINVKLRAIGKYDAVNEVIHEYVDGITQTVDPNENASLIFVGGTSYGAWMWRQSSTSELIIYAEFHSNENEDGSLVMPAEAGFQTWGIMNNWEASDTNYWYSPRLAVPHRITSEYAYLLGPWVSIVSPSSVENVHFSVPLGPDPRLGGDPERLKMPSYQARAIGLDFTMHRSGAPDYEGRKGFMNDRGIWGRGRSVMFIYNSRGGPEDVVELDNGDVYTVMKVKPNYSNTYTNGFHVLVKE